MVHRAIHLAHPERMKNEVGRTLVRPVHWRTKIRPTFSAGALILGVSKREMKKWRREAESLRKKLRKLSAELDSIERLDPNPEAAERAAKRRAEVTELLDRLARLEEKIDSYESFAPDRSSNDLLFMTMVTLGILLFILIVYVFIFPNLFSR
jgi:predicted nuclease with TOPRIM domain